VFFGIILYNGHKKKQLLVQRTSTCVGLYVGLYVFLLLILVNLFTKDLDQCWRVYTVRTLSTSTRSAGWKCSPVRKALSRPPQEIWC